MVRMIVLALLLALPVVAGAAGVPFVDAGGASHGSVKASLTKGSVKMKITGLPTLPAVPPGATFTAYVYKTYLTSTADPAVEIFLTDVYPSAKQSSSNKVTLKGDVSQLGLNRVVVTAYSKDARESFDVLTAAIAP